MFKKCFIVIFILSLVACQDSKSKETNTDKSTGKSADTHEPGNDIDSTMHVLNVKFDTLTWQRTMPELGDRSSEIHILRVDPKTQATQLLIRVPKNIHVPLHWHSANETHTIINGTFLMECDGKRDTLTAGSFNYIPKKMHHQAFTTVKEGTLLFITVDSAWDINWVNGPPKPEDFLIKGN